MPLHMVWISVLKFISSCSSFGALKHLMDGTRNINEIRNAIGIKMIAGRNTVKRIIDDNKGKQTKQAKEHWIRFESDLHEDKDYENDENTRAITYNIAW